jgi:hypothetical protein
VIPHGTECRTERHPDPDSETDIIYAHPHGDTESEADADTKRHSLSCCFCVRHDGKRAPLGA